MARRYAPLSDRQVKVLAWVADGCPDGVWPDFTHKRTTYALADRGLVTVARRRHAWSAALTEQGRHYLDHGVYWPDSDEPARAQQLAESSGGGRAGTSDVTVLGSSDPAGRFLASPADLVTELQAGDGVLTVPNPVPVVRAAYRRAISIAITDGLVPDGYVLRHKGRDHGDLVIRLLPRDEAAPAREQLPSIQMPKSLDALHDAVRQLRDHCPELLDVDESSRERAFLILQAIAEECDRRGYRFGLGTEGQSTFQVSIGETGFAFALLEEYTRREVPDPDELATARYEWQRVRSTVQKVRSGRLVIRLGERYSSVSWADRKRWTLTDKLPQLFAHIEQSAHDIAERNARAERERQERHQAWQAALVQAKRDYITDLNRRRLDRQLTKVLRADDLRRYAARIDQHAASLDNAQVAQLAHDWATWARIEADRIDPLQRPKNLSYIEPTDVDPRELEPFMPRGMNARHPPQ